MAGWVPTLYSRRVRDTEGGDMPSSGTRKHSIRIPDERWKAAEAMSERTGLAIAVVVNDALAKWVEENRTEADFEKLEAELDDIDHTHEVWTVEALKRREEIIIILAKAGRL